MSRVDQGWFIIRDAAAASPLYETAVAEVLATTPERQTEGYSEYKPTPTCLQIATQTHEVLGFLCAGLRIHG